ncbi:MAG: TIGR02147 family protein [Bdellovibrionales bacterium]
MAVKELYTFNSYREFLKNRFPPAGDGRGQRAKLAKHIGCQSSFISLVLSAKAHLSEDMAFAACDFLKLSPEELQFFLMLFHFEKAGSHKLRFHYQEQIHRVREKRAEVRSRVAADLEVDFAKQMRFFSEWLYIAIFTVVQIPEYRDERRIADKLHLSEGIVRASTTWMIENGFLKRERGVLAPTSQRIHLSGDSAFIDQHHRNWRNEAVRSLNRKTEADLHYSGSLSVSQADYFRIRELLLQAISNIEGILKPSKDEELVGIGLDLFRY